MALANIIYMKTTVSDLRGLFGLATFEAFFFQLKKVLRANLSK